MPGKTSEGFVKAAQNRKFIRNRDLKLKDSELRKEAHIQHVMVEGVCDKCRDKLQWRFHYNKYKSLTRPGTCQSCKNKCITKAYRTYCDPCARKSSVCPGCCGDIKAINAQRKAADAEKEAQREAKKMAAGGSGDEEEDDEEVGEEGMDDGEDSEEEDMENDGGGKEELSEAGDVATASDDADPLSLKNIGLVNDRQMRKFEELGKSKYSKARVAGSDQDKDIVSVFAKATGNGVDGQQVEDEEEEDA
jgi:hypothetical protein